MTKGHSVPVSEIERHREQTKSENILEIRSANQPVQIASQNVLIAPQIFAYGVHAWITAPTVLPRRLRS